MVVQLEIKDPDGPLEDTMTRHPLNLTRLAVALKAASLLAVAAGAFGILLSDLTSPRLGPTQVEAPAKVQVSGAQGVSDANVR
jgi:hypothetical protein